MMYSCGGDCQHCTMACHNTMGTVFVVSDYKGTTSSPSWETAVRYYDDAPTWDYIIDEPYKLRFWLFLRSIYPLTWIYFFVSILFFKTVNFVNRTLFPKSGYLPKRIRRIKK